MDLVARVPKQRANSFVQQLLSERILDKKRKIYRDNLAVYFPVTRKSGFFGAYSAEIVKKSLRKRKSKKSFSEFLCGLTKKRNMENIRRSYEIVGNIIILELDKGLLKHVKKIARYLLQNNVHIKTVVRKSGGHKGKLRLQKYVFVAGDENYKTIHVENGIKLLVDIRKTYFSPRSAGERLRIAKLVKPGERVLVMFSGIAPYPLVISKHSGAKEIIGIEINKEAHKFAINNIELNKRKNIKLFCGDVMKILPKIKGCFHRIIMPLPKQGESYLAIALRKVVRNGCVHFYDFAKDSELLISTKRKIVNAAKLEGKKVIIRKIIKSGQQSPHIFRVCADIRVI